MKTALVLVLVGLLFSLLALQLTVLCEAQQGKPFPYPGIDLSIENDSTYPSSNVPLNFSGIAIPWANATYSNFTCYLDGTEIAVNSSENTLPDLSNGQHIIRITASVSVRFHDKQQSEFYAQYGFIETMHVLELSSVDTGLIYFNVEEQTQSTPTPSATIPEFPLTTMTITFLAILTLIGVHLRWKKLRGKVEFFSTRWSRNFDVVQNI
jgi:hypothetical protein